MGDREQLFYKLVHIYSFVTSINQNRVTLGDLEKLGATLINLYRPYLLYRAQSNIQYSSTQSNSERLVSITNDFY